MTPTTAVRLVRSGDAETLLDHLRADAAEMRRWDPARPADFYTLEGQQQRIERLLAEHAAGRSWPGVVEGGSTVIGQVTVHAIAGEPFRKASLAYWIASAHQHRGHASRAVARVLSVMRGELALHRAEATTRLENIGSQAVLRHNGFTAIGIAHAHSFIDDRWRDVILWEKLLAAEAPSG